jgi:hypothetical protein
MRFFHGGQPGLEVGDLILPPSETGAETRQEVIGKYGVAGSAYVDWVGIQQEHDREWVFIGSRLEATRYAGLWSVSPFNCDRSGTVYEVVPAEGSAVLPDPCSPPGAARMCRRAVVVRVDAGQVTWQRLEAMGVQPSGSVDVDWRDIRRRAGLLARARAEGRHVTPAEHAAAAAAEDAARIRRLASGLLGL